MHPSPCSLNPVPFQPFPAEPNCLLPLMPYANAPMPNQAVPNSSFMLPLIFKQCDFLCPYVPIPGHFSSPPGAKTLSCIDIYIVVSVMPPFDPLRVSIPLSIPPYVILPNSPLLPHKIPTPRNKQTR